MLQIVTEAGQTRRQQRRRSGSVNIRIASFEDYDQISSLESKYGLDTKSYEEWTHLWSSNPVCEGDKQLWPIGWILEDGQRVVGYVGNIPLMYVLEGQPLIAAATRAWVVDSAYRNYSILLLRHYFSQPNVDIFLGTTANSQSSPVLGFFDSMRVPVGAWDESAFWITNWSGFASSWIAMQGLPLGRYLTHTLSGALLFRKLAARKTLLAACDGVDVRWCDGFDERFDTFWEASRREKSHMLLAVRTCEVLDWHFKYARARNQLWILTVASGSQLVAYCVFCRQDNPKFGLKRVRLVDFQALNGLNTMLLPMLRCAIIRCRSEGIHMLEYIGVNPKVRQVISTLQPYRRKLPSWLYYYKAANERLGSCLANPNIWSPSSFDGDSSL